MDKCKTTTGELDMLVGERKEQVQGGLMPAQAQSESQDYADAARYPSCSNLHLGTFSGAPLRFGVGLQDWP